MTSLRGPTMSVSCQTTRARGERGVAPHDCTVKATPTLLSRPSLRPWCCQQWGDSHQLKRAVVLCILDERVRLGASGGKMRYCDLVARPCSPACVRGRPLMSSGANGGLVLTHFTAVRPRPPAVTTSADHSNVVCSDLLVGEAARRPPAMTLSSSAWLPTSEPPLRSLLLPPAAATAAALSQVGGVARVQAPHSVDTPLWVTPSCGGCCGGSSSDDDNEACPPAWLPCSTPSTAPRSPGAGDVLGDDDAVGVVVAVVDSALSRLRALGAVAEAPVAVAVPAVAPTATGLSVCAGNSSDEAIRPPRSTSASGAAPFSPLLAACRSAPGLLMTRSSSQPGAKSTSAEPDSGSVRGALPGREIPTCEGYAVVCAGA